MINVTNTMTRDAFSIEELEVDLTVVASTGACNNPSQMYWFTPEELDDTMSTGNY